MISEDIKKRMERLVADGVESLLKDDHHSAEIECSDMGREYRVTVVAPHGHITITLHESWQKINSSGT